MGLIKLGLVVFGAYTVGGRIGGYLGGMLLNDNTRTDSMVQGSIWAGRAVTFVALSYIASKV